MTTLPLARPIVNANLFFKDTHNRQKNYGKIKDRQKYKQTDRWTDKQVDRQADGERDR